MMLHMEKKIRNSALPLLLLLAVALISSCTASREDDLRPAGGLTGLTLTITPEQPQVEELLRAASEQGLEAENKITSVDVFVFDQAGTSLLGFAQGKSVTATSGGAVSVTVDNISYKGTATTVRVAVVANAAGRIAYPSAGLTLAKLQTLTVTETSDTARTPLVMYGTAELTANSSGQVVGNVPVKRLVAAIEVKGAKGITISETHLVSAPRGATLTGDPLTATDPLTASTSHAAGERAYVYPNADGQMVYVVFRAKNASGKDSYYFFAPK